MPTASARHRRDYFATAVEVVPPVVQALAAIAAAVALTFAGHHFVPAWSIILLLILSAMALFSSSIWSWRARHLLVDRAARGGESHEGSWAADAHIWFGAGLVVTVLLVGLSIFVFVNGVRPSPNYASPYDGMDPQQSPCVNSAQQIPIREPILFDSSNQAVGKVELIRSTNCAAVWARVVLTKQAAVRLKNDVISIVMIRPGDGVKAPFAIALNGATVAYGSMLSDTQSCVRAEVSLRPKNSNNQGPGSVTSCR
jgi:hypothetical protein